MMDRKDVVDTLNRLIETSKDGEYGFRTSAEHARDPQLQQTLQSRAEECRQGAAELQSLVVQYGGTAEDSGSATGAMHRGWVAVKGTLAGYSDLAMLEECERGEDTAIERYRSALAEDLPSDVRIVIERQFEGVKRNHAQIRLLRDTARARTA